MNREALTSAIKELVRLALLALAGAFITWLTGLQEGFDPTSTQALVLGLLLKFLDRYDFKANGRNVFRF